MLFKVKMPWGIWYSTTCHACRTIWC